MPVVEVPAVLSNRIVYVADVLRECVTAQVSRRAALLSSRAAEPHVFPDIKRFFDSLETLREMGLPIPVIPQADFHPMVRRALNQARQEKDFYSFEKFAIYALNRLTSFDVRSSILDVWSNFAISEGLLAESLIESVVNTHYRTALTKQASAKELAIFEFTLGKIYYAQQRFALANDYLAGAVDRLTAPEDSETKLAMISLCAESFKELGEYDNALSLLGLGQQIVEDESSAPFVSQWRRAVVYEELGMFCYQRRHFEKACIFLEACCHYLMAAPDAQTAPDLISASLICGILLDAGEDYMASQAFITQAATLDTRYHGSFDLCEEVLAREVHRGKEQNLPAEIQRAIVHVQDVVFKGLKRQLSQD